MYTVALVNMPFCKLAVPSIGLTQLQSALNRYLTGSVSARVFYLNHDLAAYLGIELYAYVTDAKDASNAGLGDWFFRQVAFPDLPDNSEAYLRRYYPRHDPQTLELQRVLLEKRAGLGRLFEDLIDKYSLLEADLVGLSSMFAQTVACLALARKIKEHEPRIITAIGGANCEAPMGQVLARRAPMIDFVFSGQALKSFPALVRNLRDGLPDACQRIPGVFSAENVVSSCPPPIGEELAINENIELDYDSFLDSLTTHFPGRQLYPALFFETSRGCWWGERSHCTFCGLNGSTMNFRMMTSENALTHLNSLFRYAERVKFYEGVDNIMPRHYPREVFSRLKAPTDISVFYEVKSDLSEEEVGILAQAGVNRIQPGIESLATSTLKLMKKGSTAFQGINLLKSCLMHRVRPVWNLLVGFPGERAEVFQKYIRDLPLLVHLPPPTGVFPVRFDRFSPYFMRSVEYGLRLRPLDYYEFTYPYDGEDLSNLAYYFRDENLSADYFQDMARWIDRIRKCTDTWRDRWRNGHNGAYPYLFFLRDGATPTVFDSRAPETVHHSVGDWGWTILQQFKEPLSIELLQKRLGVRAPEDLASEVESLKTRGLLFEEGARYLSLVQDNEPPETDWLRF